MHRKLNLKAMKNVHFIGIGGISMSGFAEILNHSGFNVSGSDDNSTKVTAHLEDLGIKVLIPTAAANVSKNVDMVVYTAAIKKDNPEFKSFSELGVPLMERAEFIGMVLESYENVICIAGTHGKTSSTSMMAEVLTKAGLDPTIQIGGHMNACGKNYAIGNSSYFLLESCEYSNSFHHWHPSVGVILNMEADHLDFFKDINDIANSFNKFANNIRPGGTLIIGKDINELDVVLKDLQCKVLTFGLKDADFWVNNISYKNGNPSFDIMYKNDFLEHVDLPMPGEYNMLNALACFAAAFALGISTKDIANSLSNVLGIKRRFEHKGYFRGIEIIDDYAHHPTEIKAALAAARKKHSGKIICAFQPHTYTRTKTLFEDLCKSFQDADEVMFVPIFAAREAFDPSISSKMIADKINEACGKAKSFENFSSLETYLKESLESCDLLITMGAGELYKVGESLINSELSTVSTR